MRIRMLATTALPASAQPAVNLDDIIGSQLTPTQMAIINTLRNHSNLLCAAPHETGFRKSRSRLFKAHPTSPLIGAAVTGTAMTGAAN